MTRDRAIDTSLRALDAAGPRVDPTSAQARDGLRRILAVDRAPHPPPAPDLRPAPRSAGSS